MVFEASEGGALEDGEVKHYDADGACTCLGALCSLTGSPSFWLFSVLTKAVVCAGIGTIGYYCACDVRGARVGCLIFILLVSVLGIDLRAFPRQDCEGVHEGSTSVESASGDTRRGVRLAKYDRLGMTRGRSR